MAFFREQSVARRKAVIETMVAKRIPCVVVSRSLAPTPEMVDVLEQAGVPLFRTPLSSKAFTTEVTVLLEEKVRSANQPAWNPLGNKRRGYLDQRGQLGCR